VHDVSAPSNNFHYTKPFLDGTSCRTLFDFLQWTATTRLFLSGCRFVDENLLYSRPVPIPSFNTV